MAHNEFIAIKLNNILELKLPAAELKIPNHAQKNDYSIRIQITLFSQKHHFFGRTYQSSQISMALDATTKKWGPVNNKIDEFVLFYSKFKDQDLHAIAEFVLISKTKNAPQAAAAAGQEENKEEVKGGGSRAKPKAQEPQKIYGIGFAVFPLYAPGNSWLPNEEQSTFICQGSPRILMQGKPIN